MNVEITNANHNQSIPAYHDKFGPHTTNPMPIPEVQQDGNVGIAPSFFLPGEAVTIIGCI